MEGAMCRVDGHRHRPRLAGMVACVLAAVWALAGCGGSDSSSAVSRAEAKMELKQKALAEAESALTDASRQFCDASRSYVVALDRYGDVLHATEPTVGDVKEAGSDLEQPRADAMAGAEAAVQAQLDVADAQAELDAAQQQLKAAKKGSSGSTATPAPSATLSPSVPSLAPPETVNRVKQAETDFASAQKGITDQTPLLHASQAFNAAAVALELSWLRLFADAGCLTDQQQQQAEQAIASYTATLQKDLAAIGYYAGPIDGVYGPATIDAVRALQQAHRLPVTGALDKATAAALQSDLAAKGGEQARSSTATTAAVQQTLRLAGYWDGPIDGVWSPELTQALKTFQKQLGVPATGQVDTATVSALERRIATATASPSPATGSPSDASTPSPSSSATGA